MTHITQSVRTKLVVLVALMTAVTVVACGDGGKAAAETAMTALESAYEAVKADGAKYVPDQAKDIDAAMTAVKETFGNGEYMQALTDAQGLTAKVTELGSAITAKQAELTKAWEGLNTGVPGVIQGLQTQVETLSKARRLPTGVTKEAVEAAKTAVPALSTSWDDAAAAFKSANLTEALAKAQTVKAKAIDMMTSLGMTIPDALK